MGQEKRAAQKERGFNEIPSREFHIKFSMILTKPIEKTSGPD
jgi:hypothetical protein